MSEQTLDNGQSSWVLANCAETGEKVMGKGSNEQITTLDLEGMWWSCPACKGWHVAVVKFMGQQKLTEHSEIIAHFASSYQAQRQSDSPKSETDHNKENPFVEPLSPFNIHSSIYRAY